MKVIITTSGTGNRLSEYTKYTNKSLLKIGDKYAICYIIELYPFDSEFIITIGYKGKFVKDFLDIAYPNRNIKYVKIDKYEGMGSSLGYSLFQTKKYIDGPFFFHCCDTILLDMKIQTSYNNSCIFTYNSNTINSDQYSTINVNNNDVISINDKGAIKYDSLYIGLSYIYDYNTFFSILEKLIKKNIYEDQLSDIHVIREMMDKGIFFEKKSVSNWIDIGNYNMYNKYKNIIHQKYEVLYKNNESICFLDKKVIKFFYNKKNSMLRYKRGLLLDKLVPKLYVSKDNYFSMELINGILLSKSLQNDEINKLLKWSIKNLWIKKNIYNENEFKNICYNFYINKTIDRINLFKSLYDNDIKNIEYINGVKIINLIEQIHKLKDLLLNNYLQTQIHGDFILDNIIKINDGEYKLIDWRENFGENIIESGDIYYDLAKLRHNIYINHHNLLNSLFTFNVSNNCVYIDIKCNYMLINQIKDYDEFMLKNNFNINKIKILTALIWINMAPLHEKKIALFLYFFGLYNLIISI